MQPKQTVAVGEDKAAAVLRLLEALEDRVDLVDARAALAQANKKGAQSFDAILKDLGL